MKVICNQDNGAIVPADIRGDNFSAETTFPVTLGNTYNVYAMGQKVGSSLLEYLVCDELGNPFYCPSHLFSIVDRSLPSNWGYSEWMQSGFHYRIWGYKEILNYEHNQGLLERRQSDMELFSKAKKHIDECMWIDGELEVLVELTLINGLPSFGHQVLIEKRIKSNSSLKTFFLGSRFVCSHIKFQDFKTISVVFNGGEHEGECMLLVDGNKIEGTELFVCEGNLPSLIKAIRLKI